MGPPVTRSRTQSSDSRAASPTPMEDCCSFSRRVTSSLAELSDDATVHGRDAKELRDVTAQAVSEAWKDSRSATAALARQVNDSNNSLLQEFMGPPVTRSCTQSSDSRAAAPTPMEDSCSFSRRVTSSLAELSDDATVHGRDAKELRNVAAQAISGAWKDSRSATAALARQVDSNNSLLQNLNESFTAVGQRIDAMPQVSSFSPEGPIPKLSYFTGSDGDPTPFSVWLRRFEDILDMRLTPLPPKLKAKYLIGNLDGAAREKVDELSSEELRAATPGQDPAAQKQRTLEEFIACLRPQIRYEVEPFYFAPGHLKSSDGRTT
ncbi:unnamed protein product [Strongylus vulgaris]|uniref:Retrotransposon gag domain-containing protein n=1 Tax=Strongylus vulgaris TaxID=40348 RepID=A0A3P7JGQ9_STRVU|nr:unnamed protein product [Strongylus vulgaris]